ncbi:MAG: hypothetical protein LCH61_11020 [Proteobacteria bacterium]|nr:hypothetical protein [Pseudomonadota bacterium]
MTKKRPENRLNRRGFLQAGLGGVTVAATTGAAVAPAAAANDTQLLKARYQPDAANVKNFYRVNRY